jgi:hypothetical protein
MNSACAHERSDRLHTISSRRRNQPRQQPEWILFVTLSLLVAAADIALIVIASAE